MKDAKNYLKIQFQCRFTERLEHRYCFSFFDSQVCHGQNLYQHAVPNHLVHLTPEARAFFTFAIAE